MSYAFLRIPVIKPGSFFKVGIKAENFLVEEAKTRSKSWCTFGAALTSGNAFVPSEGKKCIKAWWRCTVEKLTGKFVQIHTNLCWTKVDKYSEETMDTEIHLYFQKCFEIGISVKINIFSKKKLYIFVILKSEKMDKSRKIWTRQN